MASNDDSTARSLAKTLATVSKTAKSLGIDTRKADAMVRQTKRQGSRSFKGSREEREYLRDIEKTPVITPDSLESKPDITFPDYEPYDPGPIDIASSVGEGQTYDVNTGTIIDDREAGFSAINDSMMSAIDQYLKPADNENERAYRDSEDDAGVREAERLRNRYRSQLNAITSQAQADTLALEGQGRGIPEVIIGGQQAKINREATIKALPIQAQLAAAQEDLNSAREYASRLFQVRTADIAARRQYNAKIIETVYGYANAAEQRRLDQLVREDDREFQREMNNATNQNNLVTAAIEAGAPSLISAIMSLDPQDPAFNEKLGLLQQEVGYAAQTGLGSGQPDIQNFGTAANPIWKMWDPATQSYVDVPGLGPNGGGGTSEFLLAKGKSQVDLLNSLINSSAIDSAVGTSIFGRGAGNASGVLGRFLAGGTAGSAVGFGAGTVVPGIGNLVGTGIGFLAGGGLAALQGVKDSKITGERQNFIATIKQMTDTLTLDTLIQAKERGATFGALSDTELQVLASSGTKISNWAKKDGDGNVLGYNISEEKLIQELEKINNFAKLDYVLKGGSPVDVGISVQEDGTYWVRNADGSLTQLR